MDPKYAVRVGVAGVVVGTLLSQQLYGKAVSEQARDVCEGVANIHWGSTTATGMAYYPACDWSGKAVSSNEIVVGNVGAIAGWDPDEEYIRARIRRQVQAWNARFGTVQ